VLRQKWSRGQVEAPASQHAAVPDRHCSGTSPITHICGSQACPFVDSVIQERRFTVAFDHR
jgi:hypothetical protein